MPSRGFTADEVWTLSANETDVFTMDFTAALADSETLSAISGNVTVGGQTKALGVTVPTGVTAGTPTINTTSISVDGDTIAAYSAVQVRLTAVSGTVGAVYSILFRTQTSGSNVLEQYGRLEILG